MKKLGKRGRRQFLIGAGGFTLALPLLPSLLTPEARAQARVQRRFVAIATNHGGVPADRMFPADPAADESFEVVPGHLGHHGTLVRTESGGRASVSTVLSAPADVLTPRLASKMNVVRGLGVPHYIGHHWGHHLGNFSRNDAGRATPTLDQTLAWSDAFYPDLDAVVQRSIHVDTERSSSRSLAWSYADPANRTGAIVNVPGEPTSLGLFDRLFGAPDDAPSETPRRPVVDRVLDHYRAMSGGRFEDARRLSAADRRRLDEHMERMLELQRRLESRAMLSCGDVPRPADNVGHHRTALVLSRKPFDVARDARWFAGWNDVIATALMCGASSVATIYPRKPMVDGFNSDWHERVAHAGDGVTLGDHVTSVFHHVMLDLAQKLDVEESDGETFLDRSLIQLTQESGFLTHFALEMPLVTIGGFAGSFQTGKFVDYRYRESTVLPKRHWSGTKAEWREGLTWNQYLANVAMAAGVDPSEFEVDGAPGYGSMVVDSVHARGFHEGLTGQASDPLPVLTA